MLVSCLGEVISLFEVLYPSCLIVPSACRWVMQQITILWLLSWLSLWKRMLCAGGTVVFQVRWEKCKSIKGRSLRPNHRKSQDTSKEIWRSCERTQPVKVLVLQAAIPRHLWMWQRGPAPQGCPLTIHGLPTHTYSNSAVFKVVFKKITWRHKNLKQLNGRKSLKATKGNGDV